MKKAKGEDDGPNSIDRISDLPQSILQRILYLLTQEEAVRTSVLSKSWRHIWCTRSNLQFSDTIFKGNKKDFPSVVDTTLQRYSDQRLCLEEFHLCISLSGKEYSDQELVSLLEKWIPLLTIMGVKEFRLSVIPKYSRVIIDLPSVVFEAESLRLLHLHNYNLGQKIPENIPFVRLQELKLYNVLIKQETFDKIISNCPLLTTMWFEECKGLKTIKLEKKIHNYLKHFTFIHRGAPRDEECSIEIEVPTLETVTIFSGKIEYFDAPNVECFEYSGFIIPSVSFTLTSGRSKLEMYYGGGDAQSWFLKLSEFLQGLRRSEISLNIALCATHNLHIQEDILLQDIINGGNRPVLVEDLVFDIGQVSAFPSVLNSLFCICRPRSITSSWFLACFDKEIELRQLNEFLGNIRVMRKNGNQEIWQYLEHFRIEGVDKSLRNWQPLPVRRLSKSAVRGFGRFRVRLQWSDQDCKCSPRTKHVSRTRGGY